MLKGTIRRATLMIRGLHLPIVFGVVVLAHQFQILLSNFYLCFEIGEFGVPFWNKLFVAGNLTTKVVICEQESVCFQ